MKQCTSVALQAVRRAHNERGEAAMLMSRAGLAHVEGRWDDAQRDLECALAWFTRAGDVHGRGHALADLAAVDRDFGRHDCALARLQLALSDVRAVQDRHKEAYVLNVMAKIWLERGGYEKAEALLRQALDVCPQNSRRVRVMLTYWLGETHLARGELAEAETAFVRVLHVVSELNDPIGKSCALLGLGRVRLARKEFVAADVTLRAALESSEAGGDALATGRALLALVELSLDRGEIDCALLRLDECDALVADLDQGGLPSRLAELRERLRTAARPAQQSAVPPVR